jgi:hypothetical protein
MSFFKTPPATIPDGSLADDVDALERFNGLSLRVRSTTRRCRA